MDIWLTEEDFEVLTSSIPSQSKNYDANWENLKRESRRKIDFEKAVKTKSPTLLQFESHYSFVYRRYDGSSWHTELRDLDTRIPKRGFTESQARLRENVNTLLALQHCDIQLQWFTPENKKTKHLDPRYQLIKGGDQWYCWINGAVYAESTRRHVDGRNYTEITFSTHNPFVFNLESTELKLNEFLGPKKNPSAIANTRID